MAKGTNNSFRLALPDGWEDQSVHFFMGPENSGVQHTLTLQVDRYLTTDDLDQYANEKTQQYLASLSNAELTKSERITLANGSPAFEVVCKTVPSEKQVVLQKRVYVIIDGVGYIFGANFSKKTIKTIGVEVMGIISSLVPTA